MKAVVALLVVVSAPAFALVPGWNFASRYDEVRDEAVVKVYITAAGNAYQIVNVQLDINGKEPLYCPPSSLTLNHTNYVDIFERELPLARAIYGSKFSEVPLEVVLLSGLQSTFPCAKKK